jgi:hypothetical protein
MSGKPLRVITLLGLFVILEKLETDKYEYYISENFYSTDIGKLGIIFKKLLYIKNEIVELVKKENKQ